jgi:hypothetical protein
MKMKKRRPLLNQLTGALALVLGVALGTAAYAATPTNSTTKSKTGSQKNLNFDGDYVELMNKNPLDSVTELSEANRNRDGHLYRKRASFVPETSDTLEQVRFQ